MAIGFYQGNDKLNLSKLNDEDEVFKDDNPTGYDVTIDKPTISVKNSLFTCASTIKHDLINSKIEIYGCPGEDKKEAIFTYNYNINDDYVQVEYTSSGKLNYTTSNYKYLKDNIYHDIYYNISKVNPEISFKVTAGTKLLSKSHGKALLQFNNGSPVEVFSSPITIKIINSNNQVVKQINSSLANFYSKAMEDVNYSYYHIYKALIDSSSYSPYDINTENLNIEDLKDTNFKVITSFMPVCIANAESFGDGPSFSSYAAKSNSFTFTLEDVWIQPSCNFCLYFGLWSNDVAADAYQKLEYKGNTLYTYWFVNGEFLRDYGVNTTFYIPLERRRAYVDYQNSTTENVADENTIDSIKIEEVTDSYQTYPNYGHLGMLKITINYTEKENANGAAGGHKTRYHCIIGTQRHS